jgi:type II secretion system protein G
MKIFKGFTLIELLVVISILGILIALSAFGLQGAQKSSRDGRRKADLEQVRSGIEMYKADCDTYPPSPLPSTSLKGSGTPASCSTTNVYINAVPKDPQDPTRKYYYTRGCSDNSRYLICTALENQGGGAVGITVTCPNNTTFSCNTSGYCGTGVACNYGVTNP